MSVITKHILLRVLLLLCGVFAFGQPSVLASQWVEVSLPPQVEHLNTLGAGSAFLYASMRDSSDTDLGLFRTSLEAPGLWEPLGLEGFLVKKVVVAGENDMELLAATTGETQLYYSSNGGVDWEPRDAGIFLDTVMTLAWNGEYPGLVYASAKEADYSDVGIFVSTDFGLTWNYWRHCLDCISDIRTLAAPQDGGDIARGIDFTGFWDSHPYETQDGGQEWTLMDFPLFNQLIPIDLEIPSSDPQITYFMSFGCAGRIDWWDQGVLQEPASTPFGPSAGDIGMATPIWDPAGLYAAGILGTETGEPGPLDVVRTEGLAEPVWISVGEGLPDWAPSPKFEWSRFQFEAVPHDPVLLLSAWGMGLWMRDMSDVVAVEGDPVVHTRPALSRPYPNPSGDLVTCDISLREASHLQLRIFAVNGRVVQELIHGVLPAGVHTVVVNPREQRHGRLPSGVYYLRLDGGGLRETHKILITR